MLWAANQLAHAEPRRLEAFVRTVNDVRRTQLQDPQAAGEALHRQRSELDALVRRAGELLAQHGHRATPATDRRVSDTLLGAAVDPRLSEDLRHGRLMAEQSAPGFEVLAGAKPATSLRLVHGGDDGRRSLDERRAARDAERGRRSKDAETHQRQAAELAEVAERAERERRAKDVETHRRQAAELAQAAQRAEQELRDLEGRVAETRQRLQHARRAASKATAAARLVERRHRS
jgi:DNA repair exonuclease SbcCD ATPase subunit